MSPLRRVLGAALLLASAEGCYSMQIARPGSLPVAMAVLPADQRLATWNRAISALIDAGFVPQVFNETACYVSGKRRDDLGDDLLSGAVAVVQVTPEGVVRVQISGTGSFTSQEALNAEITRRQDDIVQRIVPPAPVAASAPAPNEVQGAAARAAAPFPPMASTPVGLGQSCPREFWQPRSANAIASTGGLTSYCDFAFIKFDRVTPELHFVDAGTPLLLTVAGAPVSVRLHTLPTPQLLMLEDKPLCSHGGESRPVTYVVTWKESGMPPSVDGPRNLALFTGASPPKSDQDPGFCGAFEYDYHWEMPHDSQRPATAP